MISMKQTRVIKTSAKVIWPILSDTSKLNQSLGLAPMSFRKEGRVRIGEQKVLGQIVTWTEEPWEWKYGRWLENKRVFRNGMLKSIQGRFEIDENGTDDCNVSICFQFEAKWRWLNPLIKFSVKKIISDLLDKVQSLSQNTTPKADLPPVIQFSDWIVNARNFERERIKPKLLARELHKSWRDLMLDVLSEDKERFHIQYDAVCPHCRGAKLSSPRLTELPKKLACDSCEIEFDTSSDQAIEISLQDSNLKPHERGFDFCSADIVHKPAVVFQRQAGFGGDAMTIPSGVYRLSMTGESHTIQIVVTEHNQNAPFDLELLFHEKPDVLYSSQRISFISSQKREGIFYNLEVDDRLQNALTLTELLAYPEFLDLIPKDGFRYDFPLTIGSRALMFTDIVGSTDLYHKVGDLEAFNRVRESFLLIGEVTKRHHGSLVKTIGDATMFAFNTIDEAIEAAIDIQKHNRLGRLKIRISIHFGECISLINADGQDFFGDTVNLCAKFQSVVESDQIVFPANLSKLQYLEYSPERIQFDLKSDGTRIFDLVRITVR